MKANKRYTLKVQDLYLNSTHNPGDTCWHWTGALGRDGSPRIYTFDYERGEKRLMSAATAVWNIAKKAGTQGRIPYRKCWCGDCVNPEHVETVATQGDLMRIMSAAGRLSGPKKYSFEVRARLTRNFGREITPEDVVLAIFKDPCSGVEAAQKYNVTAQQVCKIRRGQAHRALTEAA